MGRTTLLGLLPMLLLSCDRPFAPEPRGEHFDPPAIYAAWWRSVEGCSGLTADMGTLRWRVIDGWTVPNSGGHAAGTYDRRHHAITLASAYRESETVVSHEMLHALLWSVRGMSGHPPEYFQVKCAEYSLGD